MRAHTISAGSSCSFSLHLISRISFFFPSFMKEQKNNFFITTDLLHFFLFILFFVCPLLAHCINSCTFCSFWIQIKKKVFRSFDFCFFFFITIPTCISWTLIFRHCSDRFVSAMNLYERKRVHVFLCVSLASFLFLFS